MGQRNMLLSPFILQLRIFLLKSQFPGYNVKSICLFFKEAA